MFSILPVGPLGSQDVAGGRLVRPVALESRPPTGAAQSRRWCDMRPANEIEY